MPKSLPSTNTIYGLKFDLGVNTTKSVERTIVVSCDCTKAEYVDRDFTIEYLAFRNTEDQINLFCLHHLPCPIAAVVLEGHCGECDRPFDTRGTGSGAWAFCFHCNMLWRGRIIPSRSLTNTTDVAIIERLVLNPVAEVRDALQRHLDTQGDPR